MTIRRQADAGFTLIELMMVLAIIGILAAAAVPVYRNYMAKAQFAEAFSLADGVRMAVVDAYQRSGKLTGLNSGVDSIPPASQVRGTYVSKVAVRNGVITCRFANSSLLAGKKAVLTPTISTGSVSWDCRTNVAPGRAPSQCQSLASAGP